MEAFISDLNYSVGKNSRLTAPESHSAENWATYGLVLYLGVMKTTEQGFFLERLNPWSAWFQGVAWALYGMLIGYVAVQHKTPVLLAHPSVHLLGQVAIFYLNYAYFIPRFLGKMQPARFIAVNLISMVLLSITTIQLYHFIRAFYADAGDTFPLSYPTQLVLRFFELAFFALLACIVRFSGDWFVHRQKVNELENVQLRTELALLKAQLNPHFLFNSLNSLYALALRQAPETAPGILHLSQLMRYVLYETNKDRIALTEEIDLIRRYLDLQKLRLPTHYAIELTTEGPLDQIQIEPMLLLPLVENMFKHGDSPVCIQLLAQDKCLQVRTRNPIRLTQKEARGGIGLLNLQRRLQVLYPNRHQFEILDQEGIFCTALTIML